MATNRLSGLIRIARQSASAFNRKQGDMESVFVKIVQSAIVSAWPRIEPFLEKAAKNVAIDLLKKARDGKLPEKYKWLEEALDGCIDDLIKMIQSN